MKTNQNFEIPKSLGIEVALKITQKENRGKSFHVNNNGARLVVTNINEKDCYHHVSESMRRHGIKFKN